MTLGNGVLIGVVSDLNDPRELGRVKVTLPALGQTTSGWAHVVAPMAGAGRGALFRPEVGDAVVLAAEMGDIEKLYVLGGLWSAAAPPPRAVNPSAKNNVRTIVSRSGHVLTFDDTPDKERLELTDKTGKRSFRINCAEGSVVVAADGQGDKIEVAAPAGAVTVKAALDVSVESSQGAVNISAPAGALKLRGASIKLDAKEIEIDGETVTINGKNAVIVTGGAVKID